jgi:hypothetical protein
MTAQRVLHKRQGITPDRSTLSFWVGPPPAVCAAEHPLHQECREVDLHTEVWRVESMDDAADRLIGRYQGRPDGTRAIEHVTNQPEPRR